jgi:hypothetical protein|tara:strand:- start:399 stop:749 length:351 start_codon:yes stop_codon:yes gene_type:complete
MNYKFDEDITLQMIKTYIKNTYDEHYAKDKKYQATDMIFDSGYGEGFCLGNIMKYAMRYKRKDEGYLADIKKLIHYAIILYGEEMKRIHNIDEQQKDKDFMNHHIADGKVREGWNK